MAAFLLLRVSIDQNEKFITFRHVCLFCHGIECPK